MLPSMCDFCSDTLYNNTLSNLFLHLGLKFVLAKKLPVRQPLEGGRGEKAQMGVGRWGAGTCLSVPKCLAGVAGLVAVGLGQWFAFHGTRWCCGTAQTWERPKSLAAWSEIGTVFPSLVASALLRSP